MEPTEVAERLAQRLSPQDVLRLLADLTDCAADAGIEMIPDWSIPSTLLVTGYLRSDDDSAVRALGAWAALLGMTAIRSVTHSAPNSGVVRREWTVDTAIGGVSLRLRASAPASVRARVTQAGIEVAA
jgi:hypothetical protein